MRIADCAPAIALQRFAVRNDTPSAVIHRAFSERMWRGRGLAPWLLPFLALGAWPPYVIAGMIAATWLNGAAIRRHIGKGLLRQLREQVQLAVAHGILPRWYYAFELFEDGKRMQSRHYLQRGETKRGAYVILKQVSAHGPLSPLTDKVAFAARCRAHEIRAIPVILALDRGVFTPSADGRIELPRRSLFVKPNHGKGGRGAERWLYRREADVWVSVDGEALHETALVRHWRRLPFREGLVVQPYRQNHPAMADLSSGALATVRVVTCRNERGEFEVTNAVLRMAQRSTCVVDNFHAGGLAARVDLASGTLDPATDMGIRPTMGWRETHPHSGARIAGRQLPCWSETLELVTRAHAAFADRILIGWDVGIMADGPELVEGNGGPDLDIIQRTHRAPLGDARLGELLAFHLRRVAVAAGPLRARCAAAAQTAQQAAD